MWQSFFDLDAARAAGETVILTYLLHTDVLMADAIGVQLVLVIVNVSSFLWVLQAGDISNYCFLSEALTARILS